MYAKLSRPLKLPVESCWIVTVPHTATSGNIFARSAALTFQVWIVREPPIIVQGCPLSAVSQAAMSAPLFIVKAPQLLLAVCAHSSGSALTQEKCPYSSSCLEGERKPTVPSPLRRLAADWSCTSGCFDRNLLADARLDVDLSGHMNRSPSTAAKAMHERQCLVRRDISITSKGAQREAGTIGL